VIESCIRRLHFKNVDYTLDKMGGHTRGFRGLLNGVGKGQEGGCIRRRGHRRSASPPTISMSNMDESISKQ
jgi:hypothetical protein